MIYDRDANNFQSSDKNLEGKNQDTNTTKIFQEDPDAPVKI